MLSDITIGPADTGMGGLRTVEVIEAYGLDGFASKALTDSLGNPLGSSWALVEANLLPRNGYRWATLYGTVETLGLDEDTDLDDDNGPLTTVTIRLFVPGDVPANRAAIHRLKQVPLIIRCEDNHGARRLVGTPAKPAWLKKVSHATQQATSGRRGAQLVFTAQLLNAAPALL